MAASFRLRVVAAGLAVGLACASSAFAQWDGTLAPAVRQKMAQFEANAIKRADDSWDKRQYRQACVEYSSFVHEFPRSAAAPYALFRSARCMHLQEKNVEAAAAYEEFVSTFPTNFALASCAIYFKGSCEAETGDPSKAHATWKELIEDPDYRQHPLAAEALQRVAEYYRGLNDNTRAIYFTEMIATNYRAINRDAAWRALQTIVRYHIRDKADVKKVQDLYVKCGGFSPDPQKVPADLSKDLPFWTKVAALVREHGNFPEDWIKPKKDYYSYWVGVFEPLLAENDGFRLDVASWYLAGQRFEEALKTALQGQRTPEKLSVAAGALRKLKRTDEAVALYDEIAKAGGQDAPVAAFAAAMAYKDVGNVEKMKARLQELVRVHPQSPEVQKAKSELESFGIKN